MIIFLLFSILVVALQTNLEEQVVFAENVIRLQFNEPLRIKSEIKTFQTFCLHQSILKPSQDYKIKISNLGSVGLVIRTLWTVRKEFLIDMLSQFTPMDTVSLDFSTNEKTEIYDLTLNKYRDYCFYVVGYRDTIARSKEAALEPFEYFIKLEYRIFNHSYYAFFQYILSIVLAIIASIIVIWLVNTNSNCREFLNISMEKTKDE